ncbi:MAG: ParB/RepB/Spo0J family partition protein [Candidatus Nomurabacteria bacterium]|nr:MAG: ParB/RepB/Spo0J family partition protein [Candidatus Nomurabacteria bacterium]
MSEPVLGRGLSALIPKPGTQNPGVNPALRSLPTDGERVEKIPVEQIVANPHQPRQHFDYQAQEDLIASIKAHGILQPLIVTKLSSGSYELVAGERRFRAARTLEFATVPAIVRTASAQSKLELALIENIQRKDLSPIEEAEAYRALIDEFALTQEEVARRVGKKRATVANILRLLNLPVEVQKSLRDGAITMSHAKVILSEVDPTEQIKLWQSIMKKDLTVRGGEDLRRSHSSHGAAAQARNPEIAALEDSLRSALNTKVRITRRKGRGSITIDFYSDEELENIITTITT